MKAIRGTMCAAGALALGTAVFAAPQPAKAAECGTDETLTVAEMTWLSAGMLAYVTERILEDGYGCDVEVVPGDTVPTATSMLTKGEPDIAPELWITTAQSIWNQIQDEGAAFKASEIFTQGGQEGWWVPDYFAEEHPEVSSVTDLKENWELFTEVANPDEGRLYGCPPGWGCEIITNNLFEALDLDETYELFSPGSGANLKASIARKVTRGEPIVAYYWGPTAVIGRYNLVRLDMPAYDDDKFTCLTDPDCADPQVSGWKPAEVAVAAVSDLRDRAPNVVDVLSKMTIPNDTVNAVLAWGDENSASPEDTAAYFLENYPEIWTDWVADDAAQSIQANL